MDISIGKVNYSERLSLLTWPNFKRFWNEGDNEKKTGLTDFEAAIKFGIKVPTKKAKGV